MTVTTASQELSAEIAAQQPVAADGAARRARSSRSRDSSLSVVAESDLRAQEARLLAAMLSRDLDTLSEVFDADYVFTSGSGTVWGRERALQDFRDPGFRLDQLEVEVDRAIPLQGAGVVAGRSRVIGRAGGASVSGHYRFTRVWRFAGGKWTVLATHTSSTQLPE